MGSGARLTPKYSMSLEQLAAALLHCKLRCMAQLETLFAERILGPAEAQRLVDCTHEAEERMRKAVFEAKENDNDNELRELLKAGAPEGLQAACADLRLLLPEYLELLNDPRLVPIGESAAVAPTREKACEAFKRVTGGGARLHPSYSIDLTQLGLALGHCGLCSDDLRGLLAAHARRSPPRLFLKEYLCLLGHDLNAPLAPQPPSDSGQATAGLAPQPPSDSGQATAAPTPGEGRDIPRGRDATRDGSEPSAKPAKPRQASPSPIKLARKLIRAFSVGPPNFTPPPLRTHQLSGPLPPAAAPVAAVAALAHI